MLHQWKLNVLSFSFLSQFPSLKTLSHACIYEHTCMIMCYTMYNFLFWQTTLLASYKQLWKTRLDSILSSCDFAFLVLLIPTTIINCVVAYANNWNSKSMSTSDLDLFLSLLILLSCPCIICSLACFITQTFQSNLVLATKLDWGNNVSWSQWPKCSMLQKYFISHLVAIQ